MSKYELLLFGHVDQSEAERPEIRIVALLSKFVLPGRELDPGPPLVSPDTIKGNQGTILCNLRCAECTYTYKYKTMYMKSTLLKLHVAPDRISTGSGSPGSSCCPNTITFI